VSRHLANDVRRMHSDRQYTYEPSEQAYNLVVKVSALDAQHCSSTGWAKRRPATVNLRDGVIPEVGADVLVGQQLELYADVCSARHC
jgi:hypothetical protein